MIHSIDSFPGTEIASNNKNYSYFGGTAYLGLQTDPEFQALFIANIKTYGTNYGASRKSNVRISIYEKAERKLASVIGSQACTTLSSGYLAGQLVARYFDEAHFQSFYAPNTHSALFQKGTDPYTSFQNLQEAYHTFVANDTSKTPILFLDAIDTPGVSYPDFELLKKLPLQEFIVVIDDSHGIGIMGEHGSGAYRAVEKLNPKELIVCCSLGKGYGIQAGAVFAEQSRINSLVRTNFFGGASPAAPAALATFLDAQKLYGRKRVLLKENIALFLGSITAAHIFQNIPEHPAFCFENEALAEYLEAHGIITTNFNYPNEDGPLMSRIILTAFHSKAAIQKLAQVLTTFYR